MNDATNQTEDILSLDNYPVEVLVKIFIFVTPGKDAVNLELVCSRFLSISRDEFVWGERYRYHFGWANKPTIVSWKQWSLQTYRWLKSTNITLPIRDYTKYTIEEYQGIWKLAKVIAHDDLISWCIKGTSLLCDGKSPYVYSGELIPLLNNADLPETMRTIFNETKHNVSIIDDKSSYCYHLESCVKFSRTECLKVLLNEIGLNVNQILSSQETPILVSAKFLHVECMEILCKLGAEVNFKDNTGQTSLMCVVNGAARQDTRFQCLNILLKYGADRDATNVHNNTALIIAAQNGQLECIKQLIKEGADLNIMNDHCKTALCCSLSVKGPPYPECAEELINAGAKLSGSELYHAVSSNYLANVLQFIQLVPNIEDFINNMTHGITPLMLAMKLSNSEIAEVLLKNGADVNITDSRGCAAASYISPSANSEKCLLLLNEYLSKFDFMPTQYFVDPSASTLLLYYINSRSIKMVATLLECNQVDINQPNEKGEPPLFRAVQSRDRDITGLLLEKGANVNQCDNNGVTCLMLACSTFQSSKKMINFLLYHGADPYLRDHSHRTAIDYAKNPQILQILIENWWGQNDIRFKNFTQMYLLKIYYHENFVISKYLRY